MDILYIQFLKNKKMRCKNGRNKRRNKSSKRNSSLYQQKQHICIGGCKENKVDVGLLTGKAERKMNASEMLSVCAYLEIDPLSLI